MALTDGQFCSDPLEAGGLPTHNGHTDLVGHLFGPRTGCVELVEELIYEHLQPGQQNWIGQGNRDIQACAIHNDRILGGSEADTWHKDPIVFRGVTRLRVAETDLDEGHPTFRQCF